MVSTKSSLVLIALAVALCALLTTPASAAPRKKTRVGVSTHVSHSSPSSGSGGYRSSSRLGSSRSNSGGSRGNYGTIGIDLSSSTRKSSSHRTSSSRKESAAPTLVISSGTRRPSGGRTGKTPKVVVARRPPLTREEKKKRRAEVRKAKNDIKLKEKEVQQKANEAKKGILNSLSKKISEKTGRNIDLKKLWGKLKNNTKDCAKEKQETMLDFVKETVNSAMFGSCDAAIKHEKLQKELDAAKEDLANLDSKEASYLVQCADKAFRDSLEAKKAAAKIAAKVTPKLEEIVVTKEDVISLIKGGSDEPEPEEEEEEEEEEEQEDDEDVPFDRRRRDIELILDEDDAEEQCKETVRENTVKWTRKLKSKITELEKEAAGIDEKKVEECWSTNLGEKFGSKTKDYLIDIFACVTLGA